MFKSVLAIFVSETVYALLKQKTDDMIDDDMIMHEEMKE